MSLNAALMDVTCPTWTNDGFNSFYIFTYALRILKNSILLSITKGLRRAKYPAVHQDLLPSHSFGVHQDANARKGA